jgi:hypothetical protein
MCGQARLLPFSQSVFSQNPEVNLMEILGVF